MSKREKNFAVTAIDIGETCDGHAKLIDLFDTYEEAEAFVKESMTDVLATMGADEDTIIKWDAHEIWRDDKCDSGCMWDILKVAPDSADAIQEDTVPDAEDKAEELGAPDEDGLLEVVADSLRQQGYKEVENMLGTVFYEHDGKEGAINIDVTEHDKEE